MAETTSPVTTTVSDFETLQFWCHQCNKRVAVDTPDTIFVCRECRNGFVELMSQTSNLPSDTWSLTSDQAEDSFLDSQYRQALRIALAGVDYGTDTSDTWSLTSDQAEDSTSGSYYQQMLRRLADRQSADDFLRIELNGWDDEEDGESEDEEIRNEDRDSLNQSDNEVEENEIEDLRRRLQDVRRRLQDGLRLPIRDNAAPTRSWRNRIHDMGLDDSSTQFRLQVPESDRYIRNPEDYVDVAGYESLLQRLVESDGGRRGAPPASKSAVVALPTVKIAPESNLVVCAVCKDMVNVGETETKLPCGHGYHWHCIMPWLGSRNSCPVCRFELPTDDAEYEEERKKRVGASSSSGDGSGSY